MEKNMTIAKTSNALRSWCRMAIVALAILLPTTVLAQEEEFVKVSGTVVDELGQPFPGVSVIVTGTAIGTGTDIDGNYSLNAPANGSLTFKFMGFKDKVIGIDGKTTINCTMEEDVQQVKDVVVIGYQSITREKSTAAVSSVTSEKLENIPVPSVEMALQGKVAGLNIMNISGEPGTKGIVTLRGNTNITSQDARSTPLYVIDGVIMDENDLGVIDLTSTNPISGINPNDIESIDVLKDASASAIYGARAANGVIVITTKTPKGSKPQIRVNAYYGVSDRPTLRTISVGKAERDSKIGLVGDYFGYEGNEWGMPSSAAGNSYISYWVTDSLNPAFNNNTDWQDLIFRGARIQNYDVSVSQRIEKMGYRLSYNMYDEEGTMIGTGFNRHSLSLNLTLAPYKWMNITSNIRYSEMRREKSHGDLNVFNPWDMPSSFVHLTKDDIRNFSGAGIGRMDKNLNRSLTANVMMMLDFTKHLKWTTSYSYSLNENRTDYFIPSYSTSDGRSYASAAQGASRRWEVENYIQYLNSFNDQHNVSLLLGQGAEYSYSDQVSASGYDASSDDIKTVTGISQDNQYGSSSISERSRLSFFARASYDFKDRYLFSFNWRMDGSSRYGKDNRWGHFPSISAGWIVTKESWFPENVVTDFLKFRASYGVTGADPGGLYDTYTAMTASISNGSQSTTMYNGQNAIAYNYGSTVASKKLGWEQSIQQNYGVDVHFLNKRIMATVDYYVRDSENMIYETELPSTTGYSTSKNNMVSVRNTGVELTLSLDLLPRNSDWMFTIDFNAAKNFNKIKELPYNNRSVETGASWMLYTLTVGRPLYEFKNYVSNGIFSSYDQIPVDPLTGRYLSMISGWGLNEYYDGSQKLIEMQPGCTFLQDINGDYIVDMYDKKSNGSPDPALVGGMQAMLRWKNISFSMYCSYVAGRKFWNGFLSDRLNGGNWGRTAPTGRWGSFSGPAMDFGGLNFWTEEGVAADLPTLYPWNYTGDYFDLYNIASGLFVDNGAFFKIKNISLSYDFPTALIQKIKLQRLRVYGYLDNVKTWAKAKAFPDPENVTGSGYARGDEYPLPHKYTFGLELTF